MPKISRSDIFITTKQWRAYHGYDETLKCLDLSLKRLQLDYVDLYLIHWPGPAYNTMNRRKDVIEKDGAFAYAKHGHEAHNIQALRGETWRAMEDAVFSGKCRAIGVSNFTIQHLEALRKTARICKLSLAPFFSPELAFYFLFPVLHFAHFIILSFIFRATCGQPN